MQKVTRYIFGVIIFLKVRKRQLYKSRLGELYCAQLFIQSHSLAIRKPVLITNR